MKRREVEVVSSVDWLACDGEEVSQLCAILDECATYPLGKGTLSIAFLGEGEICALHEKFLNDRTPTDVITFCGDKEFGYAGEICASPTYARQVCKEFGTTFREELTLYLVHGYLHLCGLDDIGKADRMEMRKAEKVCMNFLQLRRAIPNFVDKENFINL
ncbi:MAG: rRNA maturation RNase YbeY [Puniceicoccales bacterium]|jgi:probable rRNA maturation factor|nr:rRNA maturation RNase YbeY [Puniceicoccales bacterium]